jgi:hypothetical protein
MDQNKNDDDIIKIIESIKLINEESNRLISWALSILGSSILILLNSSDYFHLEGCYKYSYLLFLFGWISTISSINNGQILTRRFIAAIITKNAANIELTIKMVTLYEISKKSQSNFDKQLNLLKLGILIFSVWILFFLFWYIIINNQ